MSALNIEEIKNYHLVDKVDKLLLEEFDKYNNHKHYDIGCAIDFKRVLKLQEFSRMLCNDYKFYREHHKEIKKILKDEI